MPVIFSEWFTHDRNDFCDKFFQHGIFWCDTTLKAFLEAEGTILDLGLSCERTQMFASRVSQFLNSETPALYEAKILEKVMPCAIHHADNFNEYTMLSLRSRFDSSFRPLRAHFFRRPVNDEIHFALLMIKNRNFEGAALVYAELKASDDLSSEEELVFTENAEFRQVYNEYELNMRLSVREPNLKCCLSDYVRVFKFLTDKHHN